MITLSIDAKKGPGSYVESETRKSVRPSQSAMKPLRLIPTPYRTRLMASLLARAKRGRAVLAGAHPDPESKHLYHHHPTDVRNLPEIQKAGAIRYTAWLSVQID